MEARTNRVSAFAVAIALMVVGGFVTNAALGATVYDQIGNAKPPVSQSVEAQADSSQPADSGMRRYSRTEQRPSAAAMLVDLPIRVLGIGATAIGAVTWVVTLPFSALGGNTAEAGQSLVGDPARFTFSRPLGEFPR